MKTTSIFLITLLLVSCASVPLHPGAVNKTDSTAYDALSISQAIIEQARVEVTAGTLPLALKPPLNTLIDSYNLARASWLTYRAAVKVKSPADATLLSQQLDAMTKALNAFQQARSIP